MDEEQTLFIADAREIVEKLYRDLEQLRAARSQGRQRRELAARIFRRVHTLKGSAGSLGLTSVSQIAHEFEGVLDGVRLGRVEITDPVLDTFEDAADAISSALEAAPSKANQSTAILDRLNALAAKSKQQGTIASGLRSALPPEIAHSLSEYDLQHAREAIREGAKLFIVSAGFTIDTFDQKFRELSKLLGQSGEIISTVPGEPATADEINFRLLYAAELVSNDLISNAGALGRIEHSEIKIASVTAEAEVHVGPLVSVSRSAEGGASAQVRVELKQLDELISNASELFRYTSSALLTLGGPANNAVETATMQLRRRFVQLEERLIKLRLVPVGQVLERAAVRAGRIAARQLGKEVEFEIAGGDVGIDKSLADSIADPLLHLVRNAVTHGIESPAERVALGKNPTGKVRLAAFNEGSRIHITVTDDGRGIEMDRIVSAAAEYGIANNGSSLSMDQCLRLIFRPGFSTAPEVSELSGRGIGLDVVDRAMEMAGGEVRVATETGAGTTFAMIMPAALALVHCLIVRSGDQLYAIESSGVSDSYASDASQLRTTANVGQVDWRGESLQLLHLRTLLGQPNGNSDGDGATVVWHARDHGAARIPDRYALLIDSVIGQQETLVRSLGRHAARWSGVCGAAELLDGNVALVLDLEELIKNAAERVVHEEVP